MNLLEQQWFIIIHHEYIMPPLDKVKIIWLKDILLFIVWIIKKTPLKILWCSHFIVCEKLHG